LFIDVFINAESLHSCVPCGSYLHCIPAATSAPKARVFPHSISQSQAIALRVLADTYQRYIFCVVKFAKNSKGFNASAQSTPSIHAILSIPFSHTLAPYY
jgi:hypothetical protein